MYKKKHLKGFTLLELMIVIGIIALLATLVIASIQRARERSRFVGCISNMRSLAVAIEIYMTDDPTHEPPDDINKLVPDYTARLPLTFEGNEYGYLFNLSTNGYTLFCPGVNHMIFSVPADYPRYASDTGVLERPADN